MISALARAGLALGEPAYVEAADRAAAFVLGSMRPGPGGSLRVFQGGRAAGPAFLEDYAFVIAALLDLYEAAPEPRWLGEALALQRIVDAHYADALGRRATSAPPTTTRSSWAREKPPPRRRDAVRQLRCRVEPAAPDLVDRRREPCRAGGAWCLQRSVRSSSRHPRPWQRCSSPSTTGSTPSRRSWWSGRGSRRRTGSAPCWHPCAGASCPTGCSRW